MVFDMVCSCGASLNVESDKDHTLSWLIINRFLEAHVKCGFVTPVVKEEVNPLKTIELPIEES